jgi:phosphoglucosamine mutase
MIKSCPLSNGCPIAPATASGMAPGVIRIGGARELGLHRSRVAIVGAGALRGWRIVLDTANGATCSTTPVVLRALRADVVAIGDAPDGRHRAGVGSEHPGSARRANEGRSGAAALHDGDGDRLVLCDERASVLDGDEILTLLGTHALARGQLVRKTLVITVQSNLGVDAAIVAAGGRVLRTNVGDRYVIQRMVAEGATLGGESSGHIICSEISPTGDGLVAALKVLEVMLATGKPLSELRRALTKFPQLTAALTVREKKPLATLPRECGDSEPRLNWARRAGCSFVTPARAKTAPVGGGSDRRGGACGHRAAGECGTDGVGV